MYTILNPYFYFGQVNTLWNLPMRYQFKYTSSTTDENIIPIDNLQITIVSNL